MVRESILNQMTESIRINGKIIRTTVEESITGKMARNTMVYGKIASNFEDLTDNYGLRTPKKQLLSILHEQVKNGNNMVLKSIKIFSFKLIFI
jgi:hypothetical protein